MAHAAWKGRIYLDAGFILYVGPGSAAEEHSHNAVQFVWSDNGPFSVVTNRRQLQRTAVLVPANAAHALDASERHIALLLVESHGARGSALDAVARSERLGELRKRLVSRSLPTENLPVDTLSSWVDDIVHALGVETMRSPISSITRRAIDYIERNLEGVPRVADIARTLSLSPTRVTHVFSREVGIPFRRFVLWTRIKQAVSLHRGGADLTRAAVGAGFSDAAHFSRTFRAMFGLSPSLVVSVAEIAGGTWTMPARAR